MDNLIDLVRSLLSVGVVEDSVRALNENRERVTRALFGVVPAVIARWAIDLQSALEEERLADRLQSVKGLSINLQPQANNLQSQDWVAQLAHEILESDHPEETAQRIFGDAPIDDLFLEATAQYLRVPERLIKVLAPLVDGICLVTISLKLDADTSNRKELFEYIKAQQQFIPVNMMSMLAGQDVLTAPAGAIAGREAFSNHPVRTLALGSNDKGQDGTSNILRDGSGVALSLGQDGITSSGPEGCHKSLANLNEASAELSGSQPFAGGEIRWVVEDEPAGMLPRLVAAWKQRRDSGHSNYSSLNYKVVKITGGAAIALVLVAILWSGIFSGGGHVESSSTSGQIQLVDLGSREQKRGPSASDGQQLGKGNIAKEHNPTLSGVNADLKLDPEINEDEDTRAMLAAVKQAHADLEANPGKKVMSQPIDKNLARAGLRGNQKNAAQEHGLEHGLENSLENDLLSNDSSDGLNRGKVSAKEAIAHVVRAEQERSVTQKNLVQTAIKYNDAIAPEDLIKIADRLNSKDSSGGVRNGSAFLLNGISFERSTSKLERAAILPLKALAKILIENPDLNLKIVGHSDNSGRADKNQKLSLVRAWSVESQLRDMGVVGARIRSEGKGAAEPLVSNNTEEGREQNRRIEFVLYRARE